MPENSAKSILVLGAEHPVKGATKSVKWGEEVYVGDYDALIVDTTTLDRTVLEGILDFDPEYFSAIRNHIVDAQETKGLEIICLLSPFLALASSLSSPQESVGRSNYAWSPIVPLLTKVPLATKLNRSESLLDPAYLQEIKNYNLLLERVINNSGYPDRSSDGNYFTKVQKITLLNNDVGRTVAFSAKWTNYKFTERNIFRGSKFHMFFLPVVADKKLGWDILIKGINAEEPEEAPQWVDEIPLSGIEPELEKIKSTKAEIDILLKEVEDSEAKVNELNSYKKLLYSTGSDLEEIVERSLGLLGIELKKPEVANLEDRYYETQDNQKIFIEIRGVNRLMNEGDLNQLVKRIVDKPKSSEFLTRGVFVFNHKNKTKPKDRDEAFNFNIQKQASGYDLCLIDTSTLFDLVSRKLDGETFESFKNLLFNTSGKFEFTDNSADNQEGEEIPPDGNK